ncbi:MAG: hypothetical protein ACKVQT_18350, partial [Burkholderiales bacterium]
MKLFEQPLAVVNVGVGAFADAVRDSGAQALDVVWAPPAQGDIAVGRALATLLRHPLVDAANRKAFGAYLGAQPVLEGIGIAREHLPRMGERMLLHAGPPIAWEQMCGPMQGA